MPEIQISHKYKVFRGNVFIGLLPNVLSDFELTERINAAGSVITVELGAKLEDIGLEFDKEYLVTEDVDRLVTESGGRLLVSKTLLFNNIPLDLGNRVEVWEYTVENPNGVLRFDGFIFDWEPDEESSTIKATLISWGAKMEHHLVQVLPEQPIADNLTNDSSLVVYPQGLKDPIDRIVGGAQVFQFVSSTSFRTINIKVQNTGGFPVPMSLSVFAGTPSNPGSFLGKVTRIIPVQAMTTTAFTFSNDIEIGGSTDYFFEPLNETFGLEGATETALVLGMDSTASYGDGGFYTRNDLNGYSLSPSDLAFSIATSTGAIGNAFTGEDPSDMLKAIIASDQAQGSRIGYSDELGTIAPTGRPTSYKFKFIRVQAALDRILQMAPANWWYYIEPGSGLLWFQPRGQTADHIFIKGTHIKTFRPKYTLEGMKNLSYFTGAETEDGTNVVGIKDNVSSRSKYGDWLDTSFDNRVELQSTADLFSQTKVDENQAPRFFGELVIPADRYPIRTIRVGQMAGFANSNPFISSLVLQIVEMKRNSNLAILKLDTMRPSINRTIEEIKRNLDNEQSSNNPEDV